MHFHLVIFSMAPSQAVTQTQLTHHLRRGRSQDFAVVRHFLAVFVVALETFAIVLPASAQKPAGSCNAARPYITRSRASFNGGESASAIQELNRAAEVDPNCSDVYLLLGLVEFHDGLTSDSIQHYRRAIELNSRSYSAHYNLALAYVREHKLPEARAELEAAVALDRSQGDAAYNLGMVLLELHEAAGALAPLRHARNLNPGRADVAFNLVRAQLEAGQLTEAENDARASAKRFGSDFQWNAAVGQIFFQNALPKEAASYLLTAYHIHPDDTEIRHQLALACLQSGQADEVLSLVADPKTSDDYYLRASSYYASHRFEQADKESETALAMSPENPQILVLRTRLLQRAGEQDHALVMAQKAISFAPNWDEPYFLAGISYYFIRRYDLAEQNLARAVELNPKAARALFLQYISLANLGKIPDAERCLRRAIDLDPQDARLHCHLGILLLRKDEKSQAEASFRKAIQLKPEYGLSHFELGKLLVSSQQFRESAEEFEQSIKYDPGLSAAYYQLGLAYSKLGQAEKSKQMFAEFERLHKKEQEDPGAIDEEQNDDARRATQVP
jgi:tetratricopeptide (TPR) repeat protein